MLCRNLPFAQVCFPVFPCRRDETSVVVVSVRLAISKSSRLDSNNQLLAVPFCMKAFFFFFKRGNNGIKTRGKLRPLISTVRKRERERERKVHARFKTCRVGSCLVRTPSAASVETKSELPYMFFFPSARTAVVSVRPCWYERRQKKCKSRVVEPTNASHIPLCTCQVQSRRRAT